MSWLQELGRCEKPDRNKLGGLHKAYGIVRKAENPSQPYLTLPRVNLTLKGGWEREFVAFQAGLGPLSENREN